MGVIGVVAAVSGCLLPAVPAFAAGDANQASCPASTESSPGFRSSLPDCRAYELVSLGNTADTGNVVGSYGFPDGEHVYYASFIPAPGVQARDGLQEQYLATRTSAGWTRTVISLPQGEGPRRLTLGVQTLAEGVSFTDDFSQVFLNSPFRDPFEGPQLNETTGMGVYGFSLASGAITTLSLPDTGRLTQSMIEAPLAYAALAEANGWGMFLAGAAADGSRAFFVTTAKLATAPGTPQDTHEASNEIYERTNGHTYLVGVLPDGSVPVCGAEVGQGIGSTAEGPRFFSSGAVAPNGTNVVFSSPGPNPGVVGIPCHESGLFLRDVVHSTTVRLPGGFYGGRAGAGVGEEEKIFTFDPATGEIYEYHVGSGQATEIGTGDLLAHSADGTRVYFLGPEEGLYLYEEGRPTRLIPGTQSGGYRAGTIGGGLIENRQPTGYGQTRNMPVASPGGSDGSHLLFIDSAQLTGYRNEGHFEAYVYDAKTESVTCISCSPRNEPPVGKSGESGEGRAQLIDDFSPDIGDQQYQTPSPPFISGDGSRAVFETTEALVPQDVNGTMDVYEWERRGTNACKAPGARKVASPTYSPVIDGCVYLLSSGLGKEVPNVQGITDGTHLVGASEDLRDVYVQTEAPEVLLPGLDNGSKLYDVRVDGGFPYTPAQRGCQTGQCELSLGEAALPVESTTEGVGGPGNKRSTATSGRNKAMRSAERRRLARALRLCRRKKSRRQRTQCERRARRRLGHRGEH